MYIENSWGNSKKWLYESSMVYCCYSGNNRKKKLKKKLKYNMKKVKKMWCIIELFFPFYWSLYNFNIYLIKNNYLMLYTGDWKKNIKKTSRKWNKKYITMDNG